MSVQAPTVSPETPECHPERNEGSHGFKREILRFVQDDTGEAQDDTRSSLVVLAAVLALAVVVRWPNLWLIPTFTDETREAQLAIAIYRGQAAPLTNVDPYIGALWNYLVAGGFWLFGLSPWLPRLVSFVAGVGTVGATWWLGRELGGHVGGAFAAGFMAANSTHILVNSHVGWSHAITPLFATVGFACLARAISPHPSGRWLVGAGLALGLAVQTHVTAALLLPGAALAVLIGRPTLLGTRWSVLAAGAFVLALTNLVVFNVVSGGQSVTGGLTHIVGYTGEETGYDPENFTENLRRLALGGAWVLSGAIEKRRFLNESLGGPLPLLYMLLGVGAVLWAAWRGRWLPLLVGLPYVLVLPLLNPKYEPLLNGRYLVPLLPLVYGGLGIVVADVFRAVLRVPEGRRATLLTGASLVGAVVLAAYPLVGLVRYERSTERTNQAVIAAYEAVRAHRQPGETVLVDYGLDDVLYMAAGSAYKSMELLLGAGDIPYTVFEARANTVTDALAEGSPRLVVLHGDKTTPLGRSFAITPVGQPVRGAGFWVYRVGPLARR